MPHLFLSAGRCCSPLRPDFHHCDLRLPLHRVRLCDTPVSPLVNCHAPRQVCAPHSGVQEELSGPPGAGTHPRKASWERCKAIRVWCLILEPVLRKSPRSIGRGCGPCFLLNSAPPKPPCASRNRQQGVLKALLRGSQPQSPKGTARPGVVGGG